MKKLYTTEKWKRHSRARQLDELKRRRNRKTYLAWKRKAQQGLTPQQRWEHNKKIAAGHIKAPEDFSFINNPGGICKFFHQMRATAKKGKNVFIDLENIKSFTPETVAVLLSKMADPRFMLGMMPSGNKPSNPQLQQILAQSGFYEHVNSRTKPSSKGFSLIHRMRSKHVEGEKAQELINFATKKLIGSKTFLKGTYRVFLEAMMNTHGHASRNNYGQETWWAMVYYDPERKTACFSFVDNGIGIFESIRLRNFKKQLQRFIKMKHNGDILEDILHGRVGSRTGNPRRGNGIPAMFHALQRNQISNLIIVANDVYGNIANDEYRILGSTFEGTFLYWEISDANH